MKIRRILAITTSALAITAATAVPATALSPVTCTGSRTISYSPGLILTERAQTVGIDTNYANCLALTSPKVTSGKAVPKTFPRVEGCLTLANPSSGSSVDVIKWNNKKSSTLTTTYVASTAGGILTIVQTGTVTAGLFEGGSVVQTLVTALPSTLECLNEPGVTQQQAQVLLEIIAP